MHSPGFGLSAGGLFGVLLSKAGGQGRMSFTDIFCSLDFEFLNNLVFDCVSGYVSAFLNLVGGLCINMAPSWSGPCHVHA